MIRMATAADAPAMADTVIACWRHAYRGVLPDAELDRDTRSERIERIRNRMSQMTAFVIDPAQSVTPVIVGFVRLSPTPAMGDAEVEGLYVHPDSARAGLGRALVGHACRMLDALGKRSLYIQTLRDNRVGRPFYDKLGGRIVVENTWSFAGTTYPAVGYLWDDLRVLIA